MRVRSEWITIFTVTSLAVCGVFLPRHTTVPAAESRRARVAAVGIDPTPTGTIKPGETTKPVRHRQP